MQIFFRSRLPIFLLLLYILSACIPMRLIRKDPTMQGKQLLYSQNIKGYDLSNPDEMYLLFRQKINSRILYLPITPYLWAYYFGQFTHANHLKKGKYDKKIEKIREKYSQKIQKIQKELEIKNLDNDLDGTGLKTDQNSGSEIKNKSNKIKYLRNERDYKIKAIQKKKTEGNWWMRTVGQAPVAYNDTLIQQTADQIRVYLKSKGFFHSEVEVKVDSTKQKARVSYLIKENAPCLIGYVDYQVADSSIYALITKDSLESRRIQTGQIYDEKKITAERERINLILNNNGYYRFNRNYISFEADSTKEPNTIHIRILVKDPQDGTNHRRYTIDQIYFHILAHDNTDITGKKMDTIYYDDVKFVEYFPEYSKKVLASKLLLHKGEYFNQDKLTATQRALGNNLDIFRFVNVKFDTLNGELDAHIYASPLDKFQISEELGANFSQNLPGPFATITLKNRNMFKSCDIFQFRARYSFESQAAVSQIQNQLNSTEFSTNVSISFPKIVFPFSQEFRRRIGVYNPNTEFTTGVSFVNRPEFKRVNMLGTLGYTWNGNIGVGTTKMTNFTFNLLEINLSRADIKQDAFREELERLSALGNNLIRSFDNSFVTASSFTYVFNEPAHDLDPHSQFLRMQFEAGGTLSNLFSNTQSVDSLFGMRIYRYLKASVEYRHHIPAGRKAVLAMRAKTGLANPYGKGARVLPYEKYLFSGGSSSIRAWRPRRLGPGAHTPWGIDPPADPSEIGNSRFEQPGELQIEANLEWRRPLVSFIEGALFVDAGNVWLLSEGIKKEDGTGKFSFDSFYNQLAVGLGWGLRFNFSFLIIRFDIATKFYDPAFEGPQRWVFRNLTLQTPFGANEQTQFNIGIGYPF